VISKLTIKLIFSAEMFFNFVRQNPESGLDLDPDHPEMLDPDPYFPSSLVLQVESMLSPELILTQVGEVCRIFWQHQSSRPARDSP
jgi:hypothetical protein